MLLHLEIDMEVNEHGYHFFTLHQEDGNVAHIDAHWERFQTQAPILPRQPFGLDFYGKGSSIELLFTTLPRHAAPEQRAAIQRRRTRLPVSVEAPTAALISNSLRISSAPPAPAGPPPGSVARTINPEFHSPFDIDFLDGWGLDPLPFPPIGPPGGGGGGGGGLFHSAVRVELFLLGSDQPLETWELPEGIFSRFRSVKWQPQGFPNPDHPVRKTAWFRVVVTPLSFDPVEIYVGANTRITDVPIRTTPLGVRLTDHLFRVGLEALAPHAIANGSRVSASISQELTDLIGASPVFVEKDLGPLHATGKLRTLKITSVSGAKLHELALKNYKARVAKIHLAGPQGQQLTEAQKLAQFYSEQLARLAEVQNDFVCIRIEAGFSKTAVSVWGFELAKLNGELGEMFLAFDQRLNRLRTFCFFDVELSAVVSIARDIIDLFTDVPKSANDAIEQAIEAQQAHLLTYFKAFLARAVGPSNVVYDIRFRNDAWQIRNSADPVIPKPGQHLHPPFDMGPREDGTVFELLSLGHALGNFVTTPIEPVSPSAVSEPPAETPAPPPETPTAPAGETPSPSMAHELPTGFLTAGEQLDRLDRHQSIVVVMMENRSYDHMLGDLMHLRPDPENPYDGAPFGVKNAPAGGFQSGVPLVRARDLLLGTQIPVSPRHSFTATRAQIGDGAGTDAGLDTGDMAGFACDLNRRSDSPQMATTVYSERDLGVHYKLADEFCSCERWFAAHPGPTFPNRFATIMGRIPELENFENDDPRIGYLKDRNIFDALTGARIDWRVFESDLSLVRMFDRYRLNSTNVVPFDDPDVGLEATLRTPGPLPRVMFIEPDFADIPPLKTASDDHPPADLKNGQGFLARVCNLLWDTERFDEILLVITYDEHGGFYDHVPPPGTPKGEQRTFAKLHPDGPTHLGVRVPTFVVSPYVSAHAKNHTIFDHTSILKTILVHNRNKFSTDVMLSFGDRVNQMPDLSAVLDLSTPRPKPVPFIRRQPPGTSSTFGTHVDLATLLDHMVELNPTTTTLTPLSGITPREMVITERTTPPGMVFEEQDFHASLTKLMKPRRLD